MYQRLGVADANCWVQGPTRELVAVDEEVSERHSIGAASSALAGHRPGLLSLAIKLEEMLSAATAAGVEVKGVDEASYLESARELRSRDEDTGEGADDDAVDDEGEEDGVPAGAVDDAGEDKLVGEADVVPVAAPAPISSGRSGPHAVRLDAGGFTVRRAKLGGRGGGPSRTTSSPTEPS